MELSNFWSWKVFKWYLKAGLISLPFGFVYGITVGVLRHDSLTAVVLVLAGAVGATYLIQGTPPGTSDED